MAKRFTDTDKWKDDWYVSLSNDYKIVWQWLLDNCTHSGLCKRSIGLLNMMCRTNITEQEMVSAMDGRVIIHNNFWFIPKFIKFQYPTLLSNKPSIKSVVRDIFENNLQKTIPQSFGNNYLIVSESLQEHYKTITEQLNNSSQTIKVKVKVKDMVKVNTDVKENTVVKENTDFNIYGYAVFEKLYGKKGRLGEAEVLWNSYLDSTREKILEHIPKYIASLENLKYQKTTRSLFERNGLGAGT